MAETDRPRGRAQERENLALQLLEASELLDEVPVSMLAEYLARRLELEEGETMLQLEFQAGRYQKMRRYDKPRRSSVPSSHPDLGRSGA